MPPTPSVPLVLASASPARLATLRAAGIEPEVIVSSVDEDAVLAAAHAATPRLAPADAVLELARAKALDVAGRHAPDTLVLGCDSMLEFDGEVVGKPGSPEVARDRWRRMRGKSGVLHTGHWLIDARGEGNPGVAGNTGAAGAAGAAGTAGAPPVEMTPTPAGTGATSSTVVWFAELTDAEIDAYVATGEPLNVAGAFTVDGLGGPFVTRIDGDHHGVVGLSLPLLRDLLGRVGVMVPDLWA